MKKPYYVTFDIQVRFKTGIPRDSIGIPVDIEVGKYHGAKIIVKKIEEEIDSYLNSTYGLSGALQKITGIFKL